MQPSSLAGPQWEVGVQLGGIAARPTLRLSPLEEGTSAVRLGAVPIRAQVQDHCGDSARGFAPEGERPAYGFEPSREGFPSVDGRRPSSAA